MNQMIESDIGMHTLVSYTTCQNQVFLTPQNQTDCLARKVVPYEDNLFYLAAFLQQGLQKSTERWPSEASLRSHLLVTDSYSLFETWPSFNRLESALKAMPKLNTPAVQTDVFSAEV